MRGRRLVLGTLVAAILGVGIGLVGAFALAGAPNEVPEQTGIGLDHPPGPPGTVQGAARAVFDEAVALQLAFARLAGRDVDCGQLCSSTTDPYTLADIIGNRCRAADDTGLPDGWDAQARSEWKALRAIVLDTCVTFAEANRQRPADASDEWRVRAEQYARILEAAIEASEATIPGPTTSAVNP